MYIAAYISLLIALLSSIGGCGFALLQLWEGKCEYEKLVGKIQWVIVLCLLFACAVLLHALFWEDYQLEYVASYTDKYLPLFYRLTAFWAGQSGSLLFWATVTAVTGSCWYLSKNSHKILPVCSLWFWCFFYIIMAFFCLLLTSWSNPFLMLHPAPLDGQGLNPLLQNAGMIFHPPLLFIGYALFTVPACLGLATLLSSDAATICWYKLTHTFILLAWIFLTAGILLGAWWAYNELGWGGYWGWDPVENSSLLPWLSATAAIHILALQKASGKLQRFSAYLTALTVILSFFATYLTRSGIIQSVHAFGDGGVGTPLLVFVLASFILIIIISLFAVPDIKSLASPFSKEGSVLLSVWILIALTVIIIAATLWPVFSSIATSTSLGLEAGFYNQVCLPLGTILIVLMAICPLQKWSGGFIDTASLIKFAIIGSAFCVCACIMWITGYRQPVSVIAASAAAAVICSLLIRAFNKSLWQLPEKRSAFGAHLGMAIITIGISFSGPYTIEKELFLNQNVRENIGPYLVTLESIKEGEGKGYDYLQAVLKISKDDKEIGIVAPERRIYAKFGSMQFSEVDVISTFGKDIYASLLGVDEDHRVLVKISLEPLVNWIWIGGLLICILPLSGLWRKKNGE